MVSISMLVIYMYIYVYHTGLSIQDTAQLLPQLMIEACQVLGRRPGSLRSKLNSICMHCMYALVSVCVVGSCATENMKGNNRVPLLYNIKIVL